MLPPSSVGKMTLRLYSASNYSQNSARDLQLRAKWSVSAFFAKGCVHITNSKQRKHQFSASVGSAFAHKTEMELRQIMDDLGLGDRVRVERTEFPS